MNGQGKVLGYFFATRFDQVPVLADTKELTAVGAKYVRFFGDLGLLQGKWLTLGQHGPWKRDEWPLPKFCRHFDLDTQAYSVEYCDETLEAVAEVAISDEICKRMPRDGLSGFGAIELALEKLIVGSAAHR